jgi:hypothetical protein
MATVGETSRPGYVYDSATDVWIPVGIGPHSHTPAAIGAVSSSVVTAKGDLIVATSSGVVTNKSVGTDGTYLVADSTQTTGVNWAGPSTMAGRNAVLNSNMSVAQRGTSIASSAAGTYTLDRWFTTAAGAALTISRQTTSDTTNLPNIQYCMRFQRNSGQTSTASVGIAQCFETINTIPLAGKSITFSFYARAGSNYSPTSSLMGIQLFAGTGTDQNPYGSGYTGQTIPINTTQAITTTWTRYSQTATLASTVTEITPVFYMTPTGTAGTNDYFEVTGVQLEIGSVATPYAPNGATYQAELAACQRYYWRNTSTGMILQQSGSASGTTNPSFSFANPVTMRTAPTSVDFANLQAIDLVSGYALSALTINALSNANVIFMTTTATGLTAYRPLAINASTGTGYLGFSAEL